MTKVRLWKIMKKGETEMARPPLEGETPRPPIAGRSFTVYYPEGTELKYLQTSVVQEILSERGHTTLFRTLNSVYKCEVLA